MTTARSLGNLGEDFTVDYLIKLGYEIIYRNFHSRYGEIDIIGKNSSFIAFVEVKTRNFGSLVPNIMSVNRSKQLKIIKTAEFYLSHHIIDLQPRFDVSLLEWKKSQFEINYIENAFE